MDTTSVKSMLNAAFGSGKASRDGINYELVCPSCGDRRSAKRKLVVRLDDFRYHCWVCGLKGKNVWNLVRKLKPHLADQIPKQFQRADSSAPVEPIEQEVSLPTGLVPVFWAARDPDVIAVKRYLLKRGLSLEKIARWRIMTAPVGKFRRHAVIPSFDAEGEINYYVGRTIDNVTMKYRNAKVSKKSLIFNEVDIDWSKPITLVEGVFDAMKCPENTIPILGSSLSKSSCLYKKIIATQSDVTVSLDPDLKMKAYDLSESLCADGCSVAVAFAPKGKDLGELSFREARQIIHGSTRYTSYVRLSYKIGSLRSGSLI